MYVVCSVFDFWLFGWNILFVLILREIKSKHGNKPRFMVICSVIGYVVTFWRQYFMEKEM